MKITSKLIAVYQLASAAAFALDFIWYNLDSTAHIVLVLVVAVNLVAGVGLWRDLRWAQVLSLANIAAQIPAINSPYLTYWYIGIGDIYLLATIDPGTVIEWFIGGTFFVSPGLFQFFVGSIAFQGVQIYVGLFATAFTVFNVRELRKRQQLLSPQQVAERFD